MELSAWGITKRHFLYGHEWVIQSQKVSKSLRTSLLRGFLLLLARLAARLLFFKDGGMPHPLFTCCSLVVHLLFTCSEWSCCAHWLILVNLMANVDMYCKVLGSSWTKGTQVIECNRFIDDFTSVLPSFLNSSYFFTCHSFDTVPDLHCWTASDGSSLDKFCKSLRLSSQLMKLCDALKMVTRLSWCVSRPAQMTSMVCMLQRESLPPEVQSRFLFGTAKHIKKRTTHHKKPCMQSV